METTQDTPFRTQPVAAARARRRDLDALAALDVVALDAVYRAGRVPADLTALDGHPRGRMLAVRALDHGAAGTVLRRIAAATVFPWGGKSFAADGDHGRGTNRVHLLGRHTLFPFRTRVAPSVLDGRPCVLLDYDLPDNPWAIRHIHDEVREVDDGLYLGPAMWKGDGPPALVLWFALDTHVQARPIGSIQGS